MSPSSSIWSRRVIKRKLLLSFRDVTLSDERICTCYVEIGDWRARSVRIEMIKRSLSMCSLNSTS